METVNKKKDSSATKAVSVAKDAKNSPKQSFREGDIWCNVFANERQLSDRKRVFYSATFRRSYRDAKGAWKHTSSFNQDDLAKIVILAKQVSDYLNSLDNDEATPVPGK
jgi:hypothetical protein